MAFTATKVGKGRLLAGDKVLLDQVPYVVRISRPDLAPGIPGMGRIDGHVTLVGFTGWRLMTGPTHSDFALELDNGYRWKCFLKDSDGWLVNSGDVNLEQMLAD